MARRMQAQRRDAAPSSVWPRRIAWLAVAVLLLGSLGWAGVWLADPGHLPVRVVRVAGDLRQVRPQQVRDTVLPHAQAGLLRLDIAAVRASLEQMPWVYSAQVRRAWPDIVLVELKEQQVLARWADGGLVNPEGGLFSPLEPVVGEGLPLLKGPQGTAVMLAAHFIELQQTLTPLSLTVTQVTMDERRAWRAQLDNGIELMLGRSDHPARVQRFVRAWPRIIGPRIATVARVDLRYTNGFAVQWRDGARAGA